MSEYLKYANTASATPAITTNVDPAMNQRRRALRGSFGWVRGPGSASHASIPTMEPRHVAEGEGSVTDLERPSGLRLMAVHAHPDDESSKGAATTAKYAAEGHEVLVVTLTGGERGDILNPAMDRPGIKDNIAQVRQEEMAKAAAALGAADLARICRFGAA